MVFFNPTLQISRATGVDRTRCLIDSLGLIKNEERLETAHSAIRISGISANAFALEIFAYALTVHIHEFHRIGPHLYLKIDGIFEAAGVELA